MDMIVNIYVCVCVCVFIIVEALGGIIYLWYFKLQKLSLGRAGGNQEQNRGKKS